MEGDTVEGQIDCIYRYEMVLVLTEEKNGIDLGP